MSSHFDFRRLSMDERLELATDLLDSIAGADPSLLVAGDALVGAPGGSSATADDDDDALDAPLDDADELDDEALDALIAREEAAADDEDSYEAELARRGFAEYARAGRR